MRKPSRLVALTLSTTLALGGLGCSASSKRELPSKYTSVPTSISYLEETIRLDSSIRTEGRDLLEFNNFPELSEIKNFPLGYGSETNLFLRSNETLTTRERTWFDRIFCRNLPKYTGKQKFLAGFSFLGQSGSIASLAHMLNNGYESKGGKSETLSIGAIGEISSLWAGICVVPEYGEWILGLTGAAGFAAMGYNIYRMENKKNSLDMSFLPLK